MGAVIYRFFSVSKIVLILFLIILSIKIFPMNNNNNNNNNNNISKINNSPQFYNGNHALHLAVFSSDPEALDRLDRIASQTKNINIKNSLGQTALHIACQESNLYAVQILIEHNIDINIQDNNNQTPLDVLINNIFINNQEDTQENITIDEDNIAIARILLNLGAKSTNTHEIEKLKLLIKKKNNVQETVDQYDEYNLNEDSFECKII